MKKEKRGKLISKTKKKVKDKEKRSEIRDK
jgi:hypothetical protein